MAPVILVTPSSASNLWGGLRPPAHPCYNYRVTNRESPLPTTTTATASTPVAAEVDRIMNKAVTEGIALANLIGSLREVYRPDGEAIFRPAPYTLNTLRLLRTMLNQSIESIETLA